MTDIELQGFHAVKHALRFGATVTDLVTSDAARVERLRRELAPDLDLHGAGLREVDDETWQELVGTDLPSPLFGRTTRPEHELAEVAARPGPLVLLEQPRHLGNLGAVVRVAAAADAAGVLTTGEADPWHPMAVRAAAGLHLALPVLHTTLQEAVAAARSANREVVAVDGDGDPLHAEPLPASPLLLLGTERHGLSRAARDAAVQSVAIEMRSGVSSLNLATAAAVILYAPRARHATAARG